MTVELTHDLAQDHVLVDRYTDIVGPSNEMLGRSRTGATSSTSPCPAAGVR